MKLWYKTTGDGAIFQKSQEIQRHLINTLAINGAFSSTNLYMDNKSYYIKTSNNKILKQFLDHYHFESIAFEPDGNLTLVYGSSPPDERSTGD
jgi:hypothetical protein